MALIDLRELVDIDGRKLKPVINELMKATSGPGEGAAACLVMFVQLWQSFHGGRGLSLDEIAEHARTMILSYHQESEH